MSGAAEAAPSQTLGDDKLEWPATGEALRAAGYRSRGRALCSSCGASIIWAVTPYGKPIPMEEVPRDEVSDDGVRRFRSHFATCVNAAVHRAAAAKRVNRQQALL